MRWLLKTRRQGCRRSRVRLRMFFGQQTLRLAPKLGAAFPSACSIASIAESLDISGILAYRRCVKLIFIGDIVGQPGRRAVKELLPKLREQHQLDFVIANGENSAGGSGITPKTAEEIFSAGVDVITSGDHLWDQKEVMELLANEKRFLRPLNYPPGTAGQGSVVLQKG